MRFRLTRHAEEELTRRLIPRELLDSVLENPQQVVGEYGGKKACKSKLDFGGSRIHLLRAIINDLVDPATCSNSLSNRQNREILEKSMKLTYNPETDILCVVFSKAAIEESDEDKLGVILDYDRDGNIVGLEILDTSKRMDNPRSLACAVADAPSS